MLPKGTCELLSWLAVRSSVTLCQEKIPLDLFLKELLRLWWGGGVTYFLKLAQFILNF